MLQVTVKCAKSLLLTPANFLNIFEQYKKSKLKNV